LLELYGGDVMKKLVLVMVCALLLLMFIGFNYLLWDRENRKEDIRNLENSNASNNASINTLGREIKSLEDENRQLKARIELLENENDNLQSERIKSEQDKLKIIGTLSQKNEVIDKLKQNTDLQPLQEDIKKWVEYLNKGEYETAYKLLDLKNVDQGEFSSIDVFISTYRNSFKSIKIKSVELYTKGPDDDKKGDIIFIAVLEVEMDGANEASGIGKPFNEGLNERFFTVDYDKDKDKWVISNISASL